MSEELFALNESGTYHRRECSFAKDAERLVPLDQLPQDAKPCGRCNPPPPSAQANESATESAEAPAEEVSPPAPDIPESKPGSAVRARCVTPCTAQGAFRKAGDVLMFPADAVNPHFTVIGD